MIAPARKPLVPGVSAFEHKFVPDTTHPCVVAVVLSEVKLLRLRKFVDSTISLVLMRSLMVAKVRVKRASAW